MSYGSIPFSQSLLLTGSKDMTVDGSSSSKVFSYSPGSTFTMHVEGIACILKDDGTTSLDRFGAITALTNGMLIEVTIDGVDYTVGTVKDNQDLCGLFRINQFGSSAVLSILGIVTAQGFGASNNVFVGYFKFPESLILRGSDTIKVTIRDNLNNIDELSMRVNGMTKI